MATYKSHGGRILAAKTMGQDSGAVFNYMVAAFDETGIYGVGITDPRDYRTRAKYFLDRSSGEVGCALGAARRF